MSWACDLNLTSTIANSYEAAGPLFVQTLQTFFAAQCALTGDHLWPNDATESVLEDPNYDFIVVGSGSAGAVVATRLSENPDWNVLLVEAGGNPTLSNEIPQLFYSNIRTVADWDYQTQPQDGACRGYRGKGCAWPRGRVLGGSSGINAMFYIRGNKADYQKWAADGNNGWSYEDVLPYFLKIENFNGDITLENKQYHTTGGPVNIVVEKNPHIFENMVIQAATELGLKNTTDINGADQMGILVSHFNIKNNYRFGTARAYLSPAKDRKNLHVMKNAYVTKILFSSSSTNRVDGILINKGGQDITVKAKKEIIISGGSINSPQLLMLSGIGPKKHLEELGIHVKADLPVGQNLQDHVFVPMYYTMPGDPESTSLSNIFGALGQYILNGTGPLKDVSPHRVISFINTTDPTASIPDVQFHYLVMPPGLHNMLDVYEKHRLSDEVLHKFHAMNKDKFVIKLYIVLLHPKSKGKIELASSNPFDKPLIYADYFKDPEDMATLLRAIKQHVLRLKDTKAFQRAGFKLEWLDINACQMFVKASDEHLECLARELTFSLYHPTSTIKMGTDDDPMSVVDSELRVRKVTGLRVIDASIMPSIVSGNTNVPSIMIGEKGSDMIKKYWLKNQHTEL